MSEVLMGFVGDVCLNRDDPREVFREVRSFLSAPDILFANLEAAYTDNPLPVPSAIAPLFGPASNLDVYSEVGFNVVSLANNHTLDVGYDALLQTRARLRSQGVKTCGAGNNLADAREPAIIEIGEVRVAFLAYASVFPMGYEARSDRPGIVPMRAHTFWRDPFPMVAEPGRYPVITTLPDQADLLHLTEDIRKARTHADLVIASFHWGDQMRPFRLTDHEKRTAKHCIDHGADMVVGHGHHALRGMEWYSGKPIMYGLGHFVFDLRLPWSTEEYSKFLAEVDPDGAVTTGPYDVGVREGWPYLPMHPDTRMTAMAWAIADKNGINGIGFLPCRLAPDGSVYPLALDSAESDSIIDYLNQCNKTQNLNTQIIAKGSPRIAGFQTLRMVPR